MDWFFSPIFKYFILKAYKFYNDTFFSYHILLFYQDFILYMCVSFRRVETTEEYFEIILLIW